MSATLNEVVQFLLGGGEMEGCYFGDIPPKEKSQFWWRSRLREAFEVYTDTEYQELKRIRREVAAYYRLTEDALISRMRQRGVTTARHMAMLVCTELTPCSPGEIAQAFNRDRSTVATGVPRIKEQMEGSSELRIQHYEIKQLLKRKES